MRDYFRHLIENHSNGTMDTFWPLNSVLTIGKGYLFLEQPESIYNLGNGVILYRGALVATLAGTSTL